METMRKTKNKIKSSRKWQLSILSVLIAIGIIVFWYFQANPVVPQMAIYFLNEINLPEPDDKVLIFSPHPDDETIACGGYINESMKRGVNVHIVLVTDGNKHGLKDLRYKEFENATHSLGVPKENLIYLNYPDGELTSVNYLELKSNLLEQIKKVQPDIFFYPHPNDTHKDHSTVGKVVEDILQEMKEKAELKQNLEGNKEIVKEEAWKELEVLESLTQKISGYKYLVHHPHFPHLKKYAPNLFALPPFDIVAIGDRWEVFMLSEDTEKIKEKALKEYVSQLKNPFLHGLLEASIRKNEIFVED